VTVAAPRDGAPVTLLAGPVSRNPNRPGPMYLCIRDTLGENAVTKTHESPIVP
jgi:hypothetical protein